MTSTDKQTPKSIPTARYAPAMKKASVYILKKIHAGFWQPGERLPPLRRLADQSGVSLVSVWKTVHHLESQKILTINRNAGIRIVSIPPNRTPKKSEIILPHPSSPSFLWQRIKQKMITEIMENSFPLENRRQGRKSFEIRYGACYQTIQKALKALCESGQLIPAKGNHYLPASQTLATHARILVLPLCDPNFGFSITPRMQSFFRMLENRCPQLNMSLHLLGYSMERPDQICTIDESLKVKPIKPDLNDYIGFIVLKQTEISHYFNRLLYRLHRTHRPLVIYDDWGTTDYAFQSLHPVKVLKTANSPEHARIVARRLLSLGHKEIVYVSFYYRNPWSKKRLKGLSDIYTEAGQDTQVHAITDERYLNIWDIAPDDVSGFEKMYHSQFRKQYRHHLDSLSPSRRKTSSMFMQLNTSMRQIEGQLIEHRETEPLFRKALAIKGATAWICENDNLAILAREFLRFNRKRVPQDISVVGFDDTLDALQANLTSYNFNVTGAAQKALSFIVNPEPKITEEYIKGYIVERASTARAPI